MEKTSLRLFSVIECDSEQRIPIVFGTQVATRAVVENNKEGMDNFTLWGWVRESDGFRHAIGTADSDQHGRDKKEILF